MFRNFMEFFRGEEDLELGVSEETRERDLYITAAVLLTDHAMLDKDLRPDEVKTMVELIEGKFGIKRFLVYDALELSDLALKSPARIDQLFSFVRANLSVEDRQLILGLVWKAIISDEKLEATEEAAAARVRDRLGLSVEEAVQACMDAENSLDS